MAVRVKSKQIDWRRQIYMRFVNENLSIFTRIVFMFVHDGLFDNKTEWHQLMTWCPQATCQYLNIWPLYDTAE